MIKQAYINGFMRKCAEHGIDGRAVLEKLAGPRPEERKAIQRITANPKTLRALTTPEAAPPRTDDPVWNPVNVQKWVTALSTAPVWATKAPKVIGKAVDKVLSTPMGKTVEYTHHGTPYVKNVPLMDTGLGMAGGLATPFLGIAAWQAKVENMINRRRLSAAQRAADASRILAGEPVGPSYWDGNESTRKALEAAGVSAL